MRGPRPWVFPAHLLCTCVLVAGLFLDWDVRGRRSSFELFASIERLGVGAAGTGVYLLALVPPLAVASGYALSVRSRRWYRVAAWSAAGTAGAAAVLVAISPLALGVGAYCTVSAAFAMAVTAALRWLPNEGH